METNIAQIETELRHIRELCRDHVNLLDDTEERALMTAAAEVLSGLEKAFHQCFHEEENHIFSPKSDEPWD